MWHRRLKPLGLWQSRRVRWGGMSTEVLERGDICIPMTGFCWLYRASSSLATKNIVNLILGIDHLVMSICRVISCVVGRGCLVWPVRSLGKSLLAFSLLHFVLQGQTCLLFQVYLDFLLLHSNPLWWKGYLCVCVCVCVSLEGIVGLHRTSQLQLL